MARHDWVPLQALPAYVPQAFISVVDPTFDQGGAVRRRDEGNSIPRDLVRQIHLLGSGLGGEARELVMAPVLQQRVGNRDLLELYLNRVYLGLAQEFPVFGIFHAADEYFAKAPQELTLGEAATLAGLLLSPRLERPEERPGAVGARRNEVLRNMMVAGYITPQQYQEAIAERLAFQPGLADLPMTRWVPGPTDTLVIRLPEEYRPRPEDLEQD
jgi:penicillin-binding protein 1A